MENNKLDTIRKGLLRYFLTMVGVIFLVVVLFEVGVLDYWKGGYTRWTEAEFIVLTVMEVLTVVSIPFSLKFLKFKKIKKQLDKALDRIEKYKELALIRMEILILPMILNTLFYYLFMQTSFGYLAIIQLICLCFITPSKSRCERESALPEETPKEKK